MQRLLTIALAGSMLVGVGPSSARARIKFAMLPPRSGVFAALGTENVGQQR